MRAYAATHEYLVSLWSVLTIPVESYSAPATCAKAIRSFVLVVARMVPFLASHRSCAVRSSPCDAPYVVVE